MAASADAPLLRIWSARDRLKTLLSHDPTTDKLPNAREELAEAIELQLVQCGANDAMETEVNAIDSALSPHAADLKGGLLKALRVCACSTGFTRMPLLSEQTRRILCAAPAKGVATYMEALCTDIDACTDARTVFKTSALCSIMLGQGKLKRELEGHDLPAPHKKSVRTALNRATKRLAELEEAAAKARRESAPPARQAPEDYEMPEDCRKEDAQREAARLAAVDAMFAKVELS